MSYVVLSNVASCYYSAKAFLAYTFSVTRSVCCLSSKPFDEFRCYLANTHVESNDTLCY